MNELFQGIWFGLAFTIAAYFFGKWLQKHVSWIHPIISSAGALIAFLYLTGIPLESYEQGADLISLVLGPATVALGVPIYKHRALIKERFIGMILSIVCGAAAAVITVFVTMKAFGENAELQYSMLPKSVTAPIAVEIANTIGGIPEMAAVFTAITGVIGALIGHTFLRATGIRDEASQGIAMGTAAHGFGTSRCLTESEIQGTFSGVAMGLMGVLTSLMLAFILMIF